MPSSYSHETIKKGNRYYATYPWAVGLSPIIARRLAYLGLDSKNKAKLATDEELRVTGLLGPKAITLIREWAGQGGEHNARVQAEADARLKKRVNAAVTFLEANGYTVSPRSGRQPG